MGGEMKKYSEMWLIKDWVYPKKKRAKKIIGRISSWILASLFVLPILYCIVWATIQVGWIIPAIIVGGILFFFLWPAATYWDN